MPDLLLLVALIMSGKRTAVRAAERDPNQSGHDRQFSQRWPRALRTESHQQPGATVEKPQRRAQARHEATSSSAPRQAELAVPPTANRDSPSGFPLRSRANAGSAAPCPAANRAQPE